jgi:16S rRNA C967 or C1407 C5-methylase (RsmB/RsmF family)
MPARSVRRDDKRRRIISRVAAVFDLSAARAEAMLTGARRQSLRINPLAGVPVGAVERQLADLGDLLRPIPWCDGAFHIIGDKRAISESESCRRGLAFIQNASSFLPVLTLDPQPGDTILDMCAAPGGKSSHIAALTGNQARLWLNDGIVGRLRKLREVTELLQVETKAITAVPAQYLDKEIHRQFDRILLDAQCSGEGMIDLANRQSYRFWTPERIEKYSLLQRKMLMTACKLLRPGGVLVYSTCTFAPEENEVPINHLIRHRPEMRIEPVLLQIPQMRPGRTTWGGVQLDPALALSRRVVPDTYLEGFFVCRLRKAQEAED